MAIARVTGGRRRAIVLAWAGLTVVVAHVPTASGADRGWHAPASVTDAGVAPVSDRPTENTQLVADSLTGQYLYAWTTSDSGASSPLWVARANSNGVDGQPQSLGSAMTPHLAASPTGAAVAAWTDPASMLRVAVRAPGGQFVDHSPGIEGRASEVVMNSRGEAVVLFSVPSGYEFAPYAIFVASDGTLSDPVAVTSQPALHPSSIDLSDSGQAIVALVESDPSGGTNAEIAYGTRAGFGAPEVLDSGHGATSPSVAIDASGGAVVLWLRFPDPVPGAEYSIAVATRRPGESFGPPSVLGTSSGPYSPPTLGLSDAGDGVVSWVNGYDLHVVSVNTRGGQPPAPRTFSPVSGNAAVSVAPSGDALVAFDTAPTLGPGVPESAYVAAASGTAGGGFSRLHAVTCEPRRYSVYHAAASPHGGAVILRDRGTDIDRRDDDRMAIAVSDDAAGIPAPGCPQESSPTGSFSPEVELATPARRRVDRQGRFRVDAMVNTAGKLSVEGAVRLRHRWWHFGPETTAADNSGTVSVELQLAHRLRTRLARLGSARAKLVATFGDPGNRGHDVARTRLKAP